jgi:hypothetical protein
MRKILIFLLILMAVGVASAQQSRIAVKNTEGVNVWVRGDSTGIMFSTEAVYDFFTCDTIGGTTSWDTTALGANFHKFNIFCDDATKPFYVDLMCSGDSLRVPAGGTLTVSADTDSIAVRLESGSAVITINKYRRKRY